MRNRSCGTAAVSLRETPQEMTTSYSIPKCVYCFVCVSLITVWGCSNEYFLMSGSTIRG